MRRQLEPESLDGFWKRRFPGQIPDYLGTAEPLANGGLQLEGHYLVPVYLGHTDTDDTTSLHVPSIGLVVAGDAAYNDVPAQELFDQILALYPDRINPGALWTSVQAVKPESHKGESK